MGSNEKFCLRWNDFESNISVAFRELRDEKDFFDVTLACDDSQLQAHKVILSACSPFFRNILKKNPHQHPLLYLKGVKYKELQCVLNFMYQGEVNVAQEELNSFLSVAEELRVKGLTQNNAESSSSSNSARSDNKSNHRSRDPPERDHPAPPVKKPRISPPSVPAEPSNDDDIQEVVPVKSEPRDLQPVMAGREGGYQDTSQPGTVALQDTYGEDGYEYEEYEEGYDESSFDTTAGMQAGPDGNKGSKLRKKNPGEKTEDPVDPGLTGNILIKEELNLEPSEIAEDEEEGCEVRWDIEVESRISLDLNLYVCMACSGSKYSSKQKLNVISHIRSKHLTGFTGYLCELCPQVFNTVRRFEHHMKILHNVLTVSTADMIKSEESIAE